MAVTQTNIGKVGAVVLFVCISANWRQNTAQEKKIEIMLYLSF